jgi:hypothetical protein
MSVAQADEKFFFEAGVGSAMPIPVGVHDQLVVAKPTVDTIVHFNAGKIASVIDRLSRRCIEGAIMAGLEERHKQAIGCDRRHGAVLFPGAAALGGKFNRVIAVAIVAEQEVSQRASCCHILARQSAVQN